MKKGMGFAKFGKVKRPKPRVPAKRRGVKLGTNKFVKKQQAQPLRPKRKACAVRPPPERKSSAAPPPPDRKANTATTKPQTTNKSTPPTKREPTKAKAPQRPEETRKSQKEKKTTEKQKTKNKVNRVDQKASDWVDEESAGNEQVVKQSERAPPTLLPQQRRAIALNEIHDRAKRNDAISTDAAENGDAANVQRNLKEPGPDRQKPVLKPPKPTKPIAEVSALRLRRMEMLAESAQIAVAVAVDEDQNNAQNFQARVIKDGRYGATWFAPDFAADSSVAAVAVSPGAVHESENEDESSSDSDDSQKSNN